MTDKEERLTGEVTALAAAMQSIISTLLHANPDSRFMLRSELETYPQMFTLNPDISDIQKDTIQKTFADLTSVIDGFEGEYAGQLE